MTTTTTRQAASEQAAQELRIAIVRTFGRDRNDIQMGHARLTPHGTIGIGDISRGSAWDLGIPAPRDVELLMAPTSPQDGTTPPGWRGIGLDLASADDTPRTFRVRLDVDLYSPDTWIRPTLVAADLAIPEGLGKRPEVATIDDARGHEAGWPHGVPSWIPGQSVTVLDLLANQNLAGYGVWLHATRIPRGTDAEEMERLRPFLEELRRTVRQWGPDDEGNVARQAIAVADAAIEAGRPGYPWVAARRMALFGHDLDHIREMWPGGWEFIS